MIKPDPVTILHPVTVNIQKEYKRLAEIYEVRWHNYLEATHKLATGMLEPDNSDFILDASAGTGLLAEMIRRQAACHLILTDISDEMLEIARYRLAGDPHIRIEKMDVHALELPHAHFTKLVCLNSFHFYAEPRKVLGEFFRVLKKSGRLVMVDWCRNPWHFRLFDCAMRITRRPHVRSYTTSEMRQLLEASGFSVTDIRRWSHGFWSLMNIMAVKK
ncbi:MAG: class I SAM-dependent methyltransferase [Balneolales bacterium]